MAYVYTPQEWATIVMEYKAGTSLEVLAERFKKSVASVRMKLVKAGIYEKQAKSSGSSVSKSEIMSAYKSALAAVGEALL